MFKPSFPCSFQTLLQTITQTFADKELKKLESQFDDVQEQLDNTSTHVNFLNLKTLTNGELLKLGKVMSLCSEKGIEAEEGMIDLFKQLKGLSEDNSAFVWDRIYDINVQRLKQPHDYLREQNAAI